MITFGKKSSYLHPITLINIYIRYFLVIQNLLTHLQIIDKAKYSLEARYLRRFIEITED